LDNPRRKGSLSPGLEQEALAKKHMGKRKLYGTGEEAFNEWKVKGKRYTSRGNGSASS